MSHRKLNEQLQVQARRLCGLRNLLRLLQLLVELVKERLDGGEIQDVDLVLRAQANPLSA